ncbi:hypothetical protein KEM56_001864 [Ascosphaera pollenicola]|nr:hypothetical protein KEM56_001864 [Ascosphaera pollenicola]
MPARWPKFVRPRNPEPISKCGRFDDRMLAAIRLIAKHGADIKVLIPQTDLTLLLHVCHRGYEMQQKMEEKDVLVFVKTLIDYGADVNARGKDGFGALEYAVHAELCPAIIGHLLSSGAELAERGKLLYNSLPSAKTIRSVNTTLEYFSSMGLPEEMVDESQDLLVILSHTLAGFENTAVLKLVCCFLAGCSDEVTLDDVHGTPSLQRWNNPITLKLKCLRRLIQVYTTHRPFLLPIMLERALHLFQTRPLEGIPDISAFCDQLKALHPTDVSAPEQNKLVKVLSAQYPEPEKARRQFRTNFFYWRLAYLVALENAEPSDEPPFSCLLHRAEF